MTHRVGRQFAIERCLGRGGFGEVYLATMRAISGLETRVALKLLHRDLAVNTDALARLRDEGRVLARVRHPGIVAVFDITQVEGRLGLITEYIDGDDLANELGLPHRAALQAIGAVASALSAAHHAQDSQGGRMEVIHRDVKPTNIRIGRHGQAKLLDFGVASFAADDREADTLSALLVGSIPYLPPERISDRISLPVGDVYGLGCCLYEIVAGERLFLDGSLRAMTGLCLDRVRFEQVLRTRLTLVHHHPTRQLLAEMLAWSPHARPASAAVAVHCEHLSDEAGHSLPGETMTTPKFLPGNMSPNVGLRRWCNARPNWPDRSVPGMLTGLTVTEGSLPSEWITWAPELRKEPVDAVFGGTARAVITAPRTLAPTQDTADNAAPGDLLSQGLLPVPPKGLAFLEDPPLLVTTDSVSRIRAPESAQTIASLPPRTVRPWGRWLTGVGCAAAGLTVTIALLAAVVLTAWFGMR